MKEVCLDVQVEPCLQPVTGESLHFRSAIREDEALLDIRARGFWGQRFVSAFFDVRIFNPLAPSNRHISLQLVYR